VETLLKQEAPEVILRQPDIPPVAGAALLGFDRLGLDPGPLRAAYTGP